MPRKPKANSCKSGRVGFRLGQVRYGSEQIEGEDEVDVGVQVWPSRIGHLERKMAMTAHKPTKQTTREPNSGLSVLGDGWWVECVTRGSRGSEAGRRDYDYDHVNGAWRRGKGKKGGMMAETSVEIAVCVRLACLLHQSIPWLVCRTGLLCGCSFLSVPVPVPAAPSESVSKNDRRREARHLCIGSAISSK